MCENVREKVRKFIPGRLKCQPHIHIILIIILARLDLFYREAPISCCVLESNKRSHQDNSENALLI
jgi:hypothetical protein